MDDKRQIVAAFREAVNMGPAELGRWLKTAESRGVGWAASEHAESVGHRSGRRIVDLLRKPAGRFSEADLHHMRKVVGYVHRHGAQRPQGDVAHSRWRYSLVNWGHDPLKDGR